MIKKISQSFIKDMRDYYTTFNPSCGNLIKAKYVDDRVMDEIEEDDDDEPKAIKSTDQGIYFEYVLTKLLIGKGTLPKSGITPRPRFYAKIQKEYDALNEKDKDNFLFNPYGDGTLLAPYKLAHLNADRVAEYFKLWGLKVIKAGRNLSKGKFGGTLDLMVECTKEIKFPNGHVWKVGYIFVIDLKYSGFLGDRGKWSKHGWQWNKIQRDYHGTQAKQYHYVAGVPFYFLVCSSKNDRDIKLFYVPVDKYMIDQHIKEGVYLFERFQVAAKLGFVARPEVARCAKCPLFGECKDKALYPHVEVVNLDDENQIGRQS